jgi:uncharacterized membrane protein
MTILITAVLAALLASILPGGPANVWIGAALGAAFGLIWRLQGRIEALERRTRGRTAPARAAAPPRAAAASPGWGPPPQATEAVREPGDAPQKDLPRPAAEPPAAPGAWSPSAPVPGRLAASGPSLDLPALKWLKRWFMSGNVPVKVGVVLSVFGVGFLIKEAFDRNWLVLPLELRLVGVAMFGLVLLGLGWRLRRRRPNYAVSVQGGGIAVLYLTTYASYALYDLLGAPLAFALLFAVTLACGCLAVLQDARVLAVLGIVGGFLAPVLTSSGSGNHVLLFSYYTILNSAIVGIAWFKSWRELNLLGFVGTFVIGSLWGYLAYRPEEFASTEPFLIVFVLMYTLIPVLFAHRQPPDLKGFVDGTLVFGTPIVAFGLQSQLVGDTQFGLAISALALAALYAGLAAYLYLRQGRELRVMVESFGALSAAFAAIAVPLALDARWTSVAWALQGAATFWLGCRQRRKLALLAGVALQLAGAGAYVVQATRLGGGTPFLNGQYLGAVWIALAAWCSSWVLDRVSPRESRLRQDPWAWIALGWGALWWVGAGLGEIDRLLPQVYELNAALGFLTLTSVAAVLVAGPSGWQRINAVALLIAPAMVYALLLALDSATRPLANYGWLAWPCALAVYFGVLRLREAYLTPLAGALHPTGLWLASALIASEVYWTMESWTEGVWAPSAALTAGAAVALATLATRHGNWWPMRAHMRRYALSAAAGLLAVLFAATLYLNATSTGGAPPLPYLPLLNPLELASLLVCAAVLHWRVVVRELVPAFELQPRYIAAAGCLLALFGLTMTVARAVHHWTGVAFALPQLAQSTVLQAALSIVWGSAALAGMVLGARRRRRTLWVAGALLMGVVVIKLFVVELDNAGTVGRVVSFLGVGVLLLIVGYFAPVPPRSEPAAAAP